MRDAVVGEWGNGVFGLPRMIRSVVWKGASLHHLNRVKLLIRPWHKKIVSILGLYKALHACGMFVLVVIIVLVV